MVVKAFIQHVNTDAEIIALTGMTANHFVYHNGVEHLYSYEPNYGSGCFESIDGGFWVKESLKALTLQEYKDYRYNEIDLRTKELIETSFVLDSESINGYYISGSDLKNSILNAVTELEVQAIIDNR